MQRTPRTSVSNRTLLLVACSALALLPACGDDSTTSPDHSGTFVGQTWAVGSGTARTWISLDSTGNPATIGITLNAAALTNLPVDHTEYSFEFPPQAAATPFRHVGLNWNPHGHMPVGIYNVPHFDVHFYMISESQRYAITGTGTDSLRLYRAPAPEFIPTGYFNPPGTGEARMGNHWIDMAAPELNGGAFTHTFIYGTYDGLVTFWEPMITTAFLATEPNVTQDIKQPQRYAESGRYYPTRYTVRYDAATLEYHFTMDGFILR